MRVLITGGAGFIGNNLARRLLAAGHQVSAVDDCSLGWPANLPAEVPLLTGDVSIHSTWEELEPCEAIVHLAGASSAPMFPGNLVECFRNNVLGFLEALEFARAKGVGRVLYASTSSIYGNVTPPLREAGPIEIPNFYAVSKYCMEQIARMFTLQYLQVETIGFRFMSVYGPREDHKGIYANLVSQFIWDMEAGRSPEIYGDGGQSRDFTNVGDICQAIQLAMEYPGRLNHSVFNVGTARDTCLNELVEVLAEEMRTDIRPRYIPNPVQHGYVRQQLADISHIRSTLGYEPSVDLRQGIREILEVRRRARAAPPGS